MTTSQHLSPGLPQLRGTERPRTVVVLQPAYLPWLGFFDQLRRSDAFVYYDDVQYDKHGWRNRNRVKSAQGTPHWLSVPVRHSGLAWPRIDRVEIDRTSAWARKHVGTLRQFYSRAPHARSYLPALEELLYRPWESLVELDIALVQLICGWLKLHRPMVRSSELKIGGDKSGRLLAICKHLGAERYLSGDAAQDYLDLELFGSNGVAVEFQLFTHPRYPQLHGEFVPYLSIVDLILNCGEESPEVLVSTATDSKEKW